MRGRGKFFLSAFGDPGHAFPLVAVGSALRKRGHDVTLETWSHWKEAVEAEDVRFVSAPEYRVFPTNDRPVKPYQAAVKAARETAAVLESLKPDIVVNDVITLAPALAAELSSITWATFIPHLLPRNPSGAPPFGMGWFLPRTGAGRLFWDLLSRVANVAVAKGRSELNGARERLGLPPTSHLYGGISRALSIVGTYPLLEYPRRWSKWVTVSGPCLWEPEADPVEPPSGKEPLVLVAPSTSKDLQQELVRASVEGLKDLPVRVIATTNRPGTSSTIPSTSNSTCVDWLSYARTMPQADLVISHGGHGTLTRSLACGVPLLLSPIDGDMLENAARVQWAGAGLSVPRRLARPRAIKWATRRILSDNSFRQRSLAFRDWADRNNGAERAASKLEELLGSLE